MAMLGATDRMSEPSAMRDTDCETMKMDDIPMRNDGPICMMTGSSSWAFFAGGSSTASLNGWMDLERRGAG